MSNAIQQIPMLTDEYTIEKMKLVICKTKTQEDLLIYYLGYIRNYKEFPEEMLKSISTFDDNGKMRIIKEYNKVIKTLNLILE